MLDYYWGAAIYMVTTEMATHQLLEVTIASQPPECIGKVRYLDKDGKGGGPIKCCHGSNRTGFSVQVTSSSPQLHGSRIKVIAFCVTDTQPVAYHPLLLIENGGGTDQVHGVVTRDLFLTDRVQNISFGKIKIAQCSKDLVRQCLEERGRHLNMLGVNAQAGAVQSGTVSKNGEFKIAVYVIVETTPDSGGLLLNSVMTDSVEIITDSLKIKKVVPCEISANGGEIVLICHPFKSSTDTMAVKFCDTSGWEITRPLSERNIHEGSAIKLDAPKYPSPKSRRSKVFIKLCSITVRKTNESSGHPFTYISDESVCKPDRKRRRMKGNIEVAKKKLAVVADNEDVPAVLNSISLSSGSSAGSFSSNTRSVMESAITESLESEAAAAYQHTSIQTHIGSVRPSRNIESELLNTASQRVSPENRAEVKGLLNVPAGSMLHQTQRASNFYCSDQNRNYFSPSFAGEGAATLPPNPSDVACVFSSLDTGLLPGGVYASQIHQISNFQGSAVTNSYTNGVMTNHFTTGVNSHTGGVMTNHLATGVNSHTGGVMTNHLTTGVNSYTNGVMTNHLATGVNSHMGGVMTNHLVTGVNSHTGGVMTNHLATGVNSHTGGVMTNHLTTGVNSYTNAVMTNHLVTGVNSHTGGVMTNHFTTGVNSHMGGVMTNHLATGVNSHTNGVMTNHFTTGVNTHMGGVAAATPHHVADTKAESNQAPYSNHTPLMSNQPSRCSLDITSELHNESSFSAVGRQQTTKVSEGDDLSLNLSEELNDKLSFRELLSSDKNLDSVMSTGSSLSTPPSSLGQPKEKSVRDMIMGQ
ncbi:hypothetical protein EB796_013469 [Bugula neritina]|uniref:RHD domain-containing protein n=1 Tax=Bugula neritina TaxID=10212 RepID=A0A7J7JQT1_BUGNE|nr:hypothetical protein EB796_013469 [Bugula neritina]